jgi:hypothetical protein
LGFRLFLVFVYFWFISGVFVYFWFISGFRLFLVFVYFWFFTAYPRSLANHPRPYTLPPFPGTRAAGPKEWHAESAVPARSVMAAAPSVSFVGVHELDFRVVALALL